MSVIYYLINCRDDNKSPVGHFGGADCTCLSWCLSRSDLPLLVNDGYSSSCWGGPSVCV